MNQLFVGRLPRNMEQSKLEDVFKEFGELSRCDIKQGVNLCYGFIEYSDSDNATKALEKCNGMTVDGEQIVVEIAKAPARKRDGNTCFRCGNEGHWARDCSSASRRGGRSRSPRRSRSRSHSYDRNRRHRGDRRDRRDNRDSRDNRDGHDSRHYRRNSPSASRRDHRGGGSHRHGGDRSFRHQSRSRSRSPRNHHRGDRRQPKVASRHSAQNSDRHGRRDAQSSWNNERNSADSAMAGDSYNGTVAANDAAPDSAVVVGDNSWVA
ncbi:hypothetical protein H4R24_000667 [Coemansia sp. RSA 988]|nr:hypothetical protein H4R24_000667 [Coemansia sp. RSA 988]